MDRLGFLALPQRRGPAGAPSAAAWRLRLGCAGGWPGVWLRRALSPARAAQSRDRFWPGDDVRASVARLARRAFFRRSAAICSPACGSRAWPREEIAGRGDDRGAGDRRAAHAREAGFLLVISHTGKLGALCAALARALQCPVGTIYQRLGNPFIDAEVRASRARLGLQSFRAQGRFHGRAAQCCARAAVSAC